MFNFEVPLEMRKAIRRLAVERDTTIKSLLMQAVQEFLHKEEAQ